MSNLDDYDEKKSLLRSINSEESYGSSGGDKYRTIAESNKVRKRTIKLLYFTMFIGSISFSVVMSSLWPFLRKLDKTVSETYLGWVNSAFSLAQMVNSIIFGYWSDCRPSIEPLLVSAVLLAVGSGLYGYAEVFSENGIYVVLGARILLGLSAGVVTVARSVAAHLSSPEERVKVMSLLSLWQAVGFFVGPGLQALAKPVGSKGLYVSSIKLYLNVYTIPSYLMIILSIINFVLLLLYFVEEIDSKQHHQAQNKRLKQVSISFEPLSLCVIFVCLVLWHTCMAIFALNETIMSPLLMNEFAWSRDRTVFYGSIILSVAGVLAIGCFTVTAFFANKYGERTVILVGFLIMLAGFIIYLPWGSAHLKLTSAVLKYPNGTFVTSPDAGGGGGCPYNYEWCRDTPRLPFAQYLVAVTLVGIGYPVVVVVLGALYSKIIGPFPQGKYMGWLSGVGCFARVTGPLSVTAMYKRFGLRYTATGVDCMLVLTIILLVLYWRRLVPYGQARRVSVFLPPTV